MLTHLDRLVKGIRVRDLIWLARFDEMLRNVYVLTPDGSGSFDAIHPARGSLPWMVVLLLGSHSKKFIFTPQKLTWKLVHSRLGDMTNRMKWAAVFKADSPKSQLPLVKRRVLTCSDIKSEDRYKVEAVAKNIKNLVVQQCKALVNRTIRPPRFVVAALAWLQKMDYIPTLSDKDGVFVVLSRKALCDLALLEFQKPHYRPYGVLNLPQDLETVR